MLRLRFLDVPLSTDEGGYAAIAHFWARGFRLYRDVWVDRPQGLVLLYRGTEGLLGSHAWAIRLLAAVFGAGIVSVLAALLRRLSGAEAALVGAGVCALLSVSPQIEGFAANGELLTALPSTAALALFAGWLVSGRRWTVLAAGGMAGCALIIKQSGYDAGLAMGGWLVLAAGLGWRPRTEALRAIGLLAVGAAVPVSLCVLHGALTGWHDWWFSVVDYRLSVESVATGSVHERINLLWSSLGSSWSVLVPFALLAPLGVAECWRRQELCLLPLWLLFALSGFALGGLFHPHYYVGLVAPLSALSGLGWLRLRRWVPGRLAAAVVVATLVPPVVVSLPTMLASSPAQASWHSTHDVRVLSDAAVGRYLREHTTPGQTVYALYADASLYFAADRRSPYPYLWYLGVQHIPGAVTLLERTLDGPHAPAYIARYQAFGSIDKSGTIAAIVRRRYRLVTRIDRVQIFRLERG